MQRSPTFGAVVALGVAVALAAGASRTLAQPPDFPPPPGGGPPGGPPGGGGPGPLQILLAPVVQKELKLTEEQKTKVYNLTQSAGRKNRELFQRLMAGGGGGGNPQGMMGVFQQMRQENDRAIGQILDKTQSERFEEIVLQSEGPLAVVRPEIAAKLGLNKAQVAAIQNVMQQVQQSQREMFMSMRAQFGGGGPFPGGPPDPGQGPGPGGMGPMRSMGQKIRAEAIAQISKIIDRKQKAAFNQLLGAPFDLKALENDQAGPPLDGGPPGPLGPRDEEDQTKGTPPTSPENEASKAPTRTSKRKTRARTPTKSAAPPE